MKALLLKGVCMSGTIENNTPVLIKNATIVNEDKVMLADVLIKDGRIFDIGSISTERDVISIDATGKYLLPGVIDTQVHFRDPGLTHKGDLSTESKAAVAGGVTSFIDMPNTIPNVLTPLILEEKYKLAAAKSLANYGFFMGVSKENLPGLLKHAPGHFLGISDDGLYFNGRGNLLVDNLSFLDQLLAHASSIVAIHAEKEHIIEHNEKIFRLRYGEDVPIRFHPRIRTESACFEATKDAIEIARKHGARLHILHLSTEKETHLFTNTIPLLEKRITTEVCAHHLWFSDDDYEQLGSLIKWNPAIKTKNDRDGLLIALIDDRIDIVTSDHAPHTLEEKRRPYFNCMPGGPMVQHSLNILLELHKQGKISLEKIVQKMCHNPAVLYNIKDRGFIKHGFFADLAIVDLKHQWQVKKENIYSKCRWSPLEGTVLNCKVTHTFVNGHLAFNNGKFSDKLAGMALR